jgi:glycerophosphoryl diester phosphodiesterase
VATAWAYLDHPGPIPFAHRGGASEHPENTLAAFQAAVDLGYRYLETDVHVTADGVLLAFHDETLDRVTDRQGRIRDLPWSVVREARVDGQEPIPLLEEILGEWPEARVNIDVKHETSVEPLVETLRRTNSFDRVGVAAFSDGRLSKVRRLTGLHVCTALGPREISQLRIASFGWPAGTIGGACVQVPPRIGGRCRRIAGPRGCAHRRGLDVHVWTIDHATEMERLLDLGVDGIMTDRPAILKNVLERRGQWA